MNAFLIDAFEFCRLRERREGEIAVADLPRLAKESVDKFGIVRWSLQGGSNKQGYPQLSLSVSGSVRLVCQRCLTPFEFAVASESILILASDEGAADEMDALLAEDAVEVIVGSRSFDVAQIVEDDVLLMLPLSPKHEACPGGPVGVASDNVVKEASPFAVLKHLKR
jgi:uncharacterized protein